MALNNFNFFKFKSSTLVAINLWLGLIKFVLLLLIFNGLKSLFKISDGWVIPIWLCISLLIDGFLILKKPNIFAKIQLSAAAQKKYKISSKQFRRFLQFSPKLRMGLTLGLAAFVLIFCKSANWAITFLPMLLVLSCFFELIVSRFFKLTVPFIDAPPYQPPKESLSDSHRYDPGWAGSPASMAYQSIRKLNDL